MASCFQHINECLYVVKSQLRSHWAKPGADGGKGRPTPENASTGFLRPFFAADALPAGRWPWPPA